MDLPGSACAPRFTYISTVFGCHTISSDYQSTTVWTHSSWTYHWGLERSWHFDTTWSSPFQQNYEDISHTFRCTFKEYFWMVGWQKKKSKACRVASLPSLGHSQQPQPSTFLPSPFWSQRSSPKRHPNGFFLVLHDAFFSLLFKTNILFLYSLFSSSYICFMFILASFSGVLFSLASFSSWSSLFFFLL